MQRLMAAGLLNKYDLKMIFTRSERNRYSAL
jgi:hypothetical protein